jgi:hypothetical protein
MSRYDRFDAHNSMVTSSSQPQEVFVIFNLFGLLSPAFFGGSTATTPRTHLTCDE